MECFCDRPTLVYDRSSGYEVCSGCGVVVHDLFLDDSEGYHYNELGEYTGCHGKDNTGHVVDVASALSKRIQASSATREEVLDRETRGAVRDICLALRIPVPNIICDTAVEIATLHRQRIRLSGRKKHAVIAAAVYFSCKLHDAEREIRLFSSTCCMNAKLLNFGIKTIKEHLGDTRYMTSTEQQSKHYSLASQFIDRLNMPPEHFKRLRCDVLNTIDSIPELFDSGKKPRTILSAIILMSIRRMNLDVDKKKMFQTFRVCSQSVDNCATFIQNKYNI